MIRLYHSPTVQNCRRYDRTYVSQQEFKYLKEHLTARMVQILTEERGSSLEEAFERIYTSPIYGKLSDALNGVVFSVATLRVVLYLIRAE